jgi:hypothetical protein
MKGNAVDNPIVATKEEFLELLWWKFNTYPDGIWSDSAQGFGKAIDLVERWQLPAGKGKHIRPEGE